MVLLFRFFFFFQAEDGIRDLVRSRGLGDVYKRQAFELVGFPKEKRFSTISECIEEFYSVKDSNIVLELSLIHI